MVNMRMKWHAESDGDRTILSFYDEPSDGRAAEALSASEIAALARQDSELLVKLNSAAGSVADGLSIYSALSKRDTGRLSTLVQFAAGAALPIMLAAPVENRHLAPGGVIVTQQPHVARVQHPTDMAQSIRSETAALAGLLSERVGRWDAETWSATLGRMTWFSDQQCVDNGFVCDITTEDELRSPRPAATARGRKR